MRWPWSPRRTPELEAAEARLSEADAKLARAHLLAEQAATEGRRLRAIQRRNGLSEAIAQDWRRGRS